MVQEALAKTNICAALQWYCMDLLASTVQTNETLLTKLCVVSRHLDNPAAATEEDLDTQHMQHGGTAAGSTTNTTPAKPKSTALPCKAVDNRFAYMVLTMQDVVHCKPALQATVLSDLVTDEYMTDLEVQVSLWQCNLVLCLLASIVC